MPTKTLSGLVRVRLWEISAIQFFCFQTQKKISLSHTISIPIYLPTTCQLFIQEYNTCKVGHSGAQTFLFMTSSMVYNSMRVRNRGQAHVNQNTINIPDIFTTQCHSFTTVSCRNTTPAKLQSIGMIKTLNRLGCSDCHSKTLAYIGLTAIWAYCLNNTIQNSNLFSYQLHNSTTKSSPNFSSKFQYLHRSIYCILSFTSPLPCLQHRLGL